MKLREQSITNISSFLTIIISLIIAVSIPVTYFIVVYQYMDGTINAEIAFSARAVEEMVTKNPKSWQFDEIRLQKILGRRLDNNHRDNRRIRDLRGRVVAQTKEPLAHPTVTFSQPVYDSGTEVASIEIERSIIPLVTNTVLLGVCSILSGVLISLFFHFLPLRTMREAYDKLQKSESFFKEITDNASDVIFITDRNGDIKYCSRSVERFLGYKSEELIGRSAFAFIHPDELERAFNDYSEALLSKDKAIFNAFRVLHKDGSERYFEGLGENLLDNPLVSGFIMNIYDSTARKRMEEELKENASRYKELFDNANVGIYRIDFKTGKFSDANNTFLEYAGYSQEELNALSPYDILTEDSKKRFVERLEKMSRGEKVPETIEYDVVDRNGKQRCIHLNNKNVYDAHGHVIASEVVAQDITQRKLEANALRESERQYKLITEKMSDIVWIVDPDLRTIYVTPSVQTVLGFSQEERMHQTVDQQITPDSLSLGLEILAYERTIEEQGNADPNRTVTLILEYYHKDGSTRWMETTMSGLRNDKGVLTGLHGVSRDVTKRKLAEEKLRKSEELYTRLVNSIPDIIIRTDLEGNILFVNDQVLQSGGYRKDEIEGRNLLIFAAHEDQEKIVRDLQRVREGSRLGPAEYNLLTKDGEIKPFDVNGDVLYNEEGKPFGFVCVCRDISERKKVEEALSRSEEKHRTIIENIEDGYAEVDLKGNFLFVNNALCIIDGYPKNELMKLNYRDIMDEKNAKKIYAAYHKVFITGESEKNLEYEIITKNGIIKFLETSVSPIKDADKRVIAFRGIVRDRTERKLAEEKFYKIFMTTPDCIAITRLKDGLIKDVNQGFEDMVGWKREIAIGTKSTESPLNFWVDLSERDFLTAELGIGRDILHRQIEFRRSDNSIRTGIYSARPINVDGEESLIFILQDITEQKRMEKELAESNKTKLMSQIASGVAHEVRNPLHAIQAISEAMAIDMDEKSDHRDYLMHIKTQVKRLSHLMNDLLDLGKPIQSSLFSQAPLAEIATAALGFWMEAHPQLSQRVRIVNNLRHDALVLADSNKIQQVIINLMENAAQNNPKDEMILLGLSNASERYLMVEVIDKGVGLKSQDQLKVFEPFYTTRKGGTGLGLSLCKHIIENHGGTIEIFNNKDMPGCTARFTIPVYNSEVHK